MASDVVVLRLYEVERVDMATEGYQWALNANFTPARWRNTLVVDCGLGSESKSLYGCTSSSNESPVALSFTRETQCPRNRSGRLRPRLYGC